MMCREKPGIWSVAGPPDHFSMVSISDQPDPDCTETARPGDWPRTLFPGVN